MKAKRKSKARKSTRKSAARTVIIDGPPIEPPPLDAIPDPEVKAKLETWWQQLQRAMGWRG
jgi:hypothetical protein